MSLKSVLGYFYPEKMQENIANYFPLGYFLPLYHSVSDFYLPHLKHIINYKNPKQFVNDLDFMGRNFEFVTWQEFKDFQLGTFKPKKKIALLTFDDGFREFKEVIAPILLEKGIFAMNFINPQFIDNQDLMFRCKASLLVEKVRTISHLPSEIFTILNLKSEDKESCVKSILFINYQKKNKLDELAIALGVDFGEFLSKNEPYLNIEELHALKAKGFEFGAHSWDHPLYHELGLESQLDQTERSLKYLRNNALQHESFAFPFTDFGVKHEFFEQIFSHESNLVYTFGTAGLKTDEFSKNLQRTPMETGQSAKETIVAEMAYYEAKKWFGKNTLKRQ